MAERCVRLTLGYDGTDFYGWQRQKEGPSVQGEIERVLEKIHHHPVTLNGAGRTDTGVHAKGQVASFFTDIDSMPIERFAIALNSLLPRSIRIYKSELAPEGFHARFSARARSYRYFIVQESQALPQDYRYAWVMREWPDINALNRMASAFSGEVDFTAFCNQQDESLSRHRYVHSAHFFYEGRFLVFEIKANAFLWRMVRSLVGSLIEFERNGLDEDYVRMVLEKKQRSLSGATAPGTGLFLWSVDY
jgi:tRNA pseudouridine38-40 synthase